MEALPKEEHQNLSVRGVPSGMWPTRDGRRQKPWLRLSKKRDGYLLELPSRRLTLFDPEKCLRVGRHNGMLGIVYEVRIPKKEKQRGLILDSKKGGGRRRWTGDEPSELMESALGMALSLAGMSSPPRWVVVLLAARDGKTEWGPTKFWLGLIEQLRIGLDLEEVQAVMES